MEDKNMCFFKKAAPDDILINEFWTWFIGFENRIADVIRNAGSEKADEKKAYEIIVALSEQMQRICFDSKELVEFEFGGDPDERLELVFFPYNAYVKNNIKRVAELMPSELKEKWKLLIC